MNSHEMGVLTFLALGIALMFLPNVLRLRGQDTHKGIETISQPKNWQLWLSILAFLQAIAFVAIAIVLEATGIHWVVGLLCIFASFLCLAFVLLLFGLRPRHFLR